MGSRPILSRSDLAHAELIHEDGRRKPRVYRIWHDGRAYAVKDAAGMHWWGRTLWRWWLRREARAYEALAGIEGIAACHGFLDRQALILDFLDGRFLCRETSVRVVPDFFDRLTRIVAEMHARGWFHLDLGHRRNVLVLADGRPGVIDFAGALPWARVPLVGALGRWIDRRCVARLARRYGQASRAPRSEPVAS